MHRVLTLTIASLLCAAVAFADVRTEEKTQLKFEGGLGRMLNLFGGRSMRDGTVSTVALKGDRKMTVNDQTGQLIDLAEEKIYDIDFRNKTYRVTTFAEMIKSMQEARARAAEQASKESGSAPAPASDPNQPQYEVDFSLNESGQKRVVNGFDAREVVMTVTVREKGKKIEEGGGFAVVSNIWLAPRVPGVEEMAAFERRYAEKLLAPALLDAQQMAAAAAMYPMMSDAIARMEKEKVNMDGTPVQTVTRFEAVASATEARAGAEKEARPEESRPSGLGGLGGRLARRALERNKKEEPPPAANADPNRTTVMTFQQEILKVSGTVADADVSVPAGFRQR